MAPRQAEVMAPESSTSPDVPATDEDLKFLPHQILSPAHETVQAAFESPGESVPEPELANNNTKNPCDTPVATLEDAIDTSVVKLLKGAISQVAAGPEEDLRSLERKVWDI